MLKLLEVCESDIHMYPFEFAKTLQYWDRPVFLYFFFIYDDKENIYYIYTQFDIENNFFSKGRRVEGLKSKNKQLVDFDRTVRNNKSGLFRCIKTNSKVIMGNHTKTTLSYYYKDIKIGTCYYWDFGVLKTRYGVDYTRYLNSVYYDTSNNKYNNNPILLIREITEVEWAKAKKTKYKCVIETINEYIKRNKLVLITNVFSNIKATELDLRGLKVSHLFSFNGLFFKDTFLEKVYLCDINLNKPIIFKEMFLGCGCLKYIDMSNLKGDYPENYYNISEDKLNEILYLGLDDSKDKIIVLPKSAKNFIKILSEVNKLEYLGTIKKNNKEKEIEILYAKEILRYTNKTPKRYLVIEE
ncbi:MAG: hypothetical protein IJZ36_03200 [Bacilli bacterium]|nr:hypothetical protein [Bacilli bacterium]